MPKRDSRATRGAAALKREVSARHLVGADQTRMSVRPLVEARAVGSTSSQLPSAGSAAMNDKVLVF